MLARTVVLWPAVRSPRRADLPRKNGLLNRAQGRLELPDIPRFQERWNARQLAPQLDGKGEYRTETPEMGQLRKNGADRREEDT